jgi:hypothetical protein
MPTIAPFHNSYLASGHGSGKLSASVRFGNRKWAPDVQKSISDAKLRTMRALINTELASFLLKPLVKTNDAVWLELAFLDARDAYEKLPLYKKLKQAIRKGPETQKSRYERAAADIKQALEAVGVKEIKPVKNGGHFYFLVKFEPGTSSALLSQLPKSFDSWSHGKFDIRANYEGQPDDAIERMSGS